MTLETIKIREKELTKTIGEAFQLACECIKSGEIDKIVSYRANKTNVERIAGSNFIKNSIKEFSYTSYEDLKAKIKEAEEFVASLKNNNEMLFRSIDIKADAYDDEVQNQYIAVLFYEVVPPSAQLTKQLINSELLEELRASILAHLGLSTKNDFFKIDMNDKTTTLYRDGKIDFQTLCDICKK